MFQIAQWTFKNPWILAPMAGVSEMPFRCLVLRDFGASAAPTELVSAKGLLSPQASSRSQRYLTYNPAIESPFWVQLFGGDPNVMAQGAEQAAKLGAQIIDINMGCPMRKITSNNGAGSALLCDPKRAALMVQNICALGLPVTVKMRAGFQTIDVSYLIDFAKRLEDAGCAAIALHARSKAQGYTGKADWALIKVLVENLNIPVIGNGDVSTAQQAHHMLESTGCKAVMIGRGALGNPWIFRELTTGVHLVTPNERWQVISQHFNAHLEFIANELMAVRRFRSHFAWYAQHLMQSKIFIDTLNRTDCVQDVLEIAEAYFTLAEPSQEFISTDFDTRMALG